MALTRDQQFRILDWAILLTTSIIALILFHVPPDHHSFSIIDLSLSFPQRPKPKVSLPLLLFLSVITPTLLILILSLHQTHSTSPLPHTLNPSSLYTGVRAAHTSLLGLGLSLSTSLIILNSKNLFGVPRPDFLSRCKPDVDRLADHIVGSSYGQVLSAPWVLVNREICTARFADVNEGFRSMPCGGALVAFAGLGYLTLWLAARLGIASSRSAKAGSANDGYEGGGRLLDDNHERESHDVPVEFQGQAYEERLRRTQRPISPQPLFFLILPYLSFGLALFVAGSRYFDFSNHGWDVVAGAGGGSASALFAFWFYGPL